MTKKLKTRVWDAAENLDSEGDVNLMKPNPGGFSSAKRQGLTPAAARNLEQNRREKRPPNMTISDRNYFAAS